MSKITNTLGQLIEWFDRHHAPMHQDGGVDEISITELAGTKVCTFHVNAFQYYAPGTDWSPLWYGALLGANKSNKSLYLPLSFLKVGDIITNYTVGIRLNVVAGDTVTADCALIRVNTGDSPTKTSVTNGAITQLTADGFTQAAANNDDETVATGKQYALEIKGTTSNVSTTESVICFGAEVTITRIM